MKYDKVTKKQMLMDVELKLLDTWERCDSYEQFIVEVDTKFPEAPKKMLLAFKVHYFKRMHPFLYFMSHIAWLVLNMALSAMVFSFTGLCIHEVLRCGIACGFFTWFLFLMPVYNPFMGDLMDTIKWYDDGKPVDDVYL